MYKIYFRIENLHKVNANSIRFTDGGVNLYRDQDTILCSNKTEMFIKEEPTYITRLMDFVPPLEVIIRLEGNYYMVDDVCYRLKEGTGPTIVEIVAKPCIWEE